MSSAEQFARADLRRGRVPGVRRVPIGAQPPAVGVPTPQRGAPRIGTTGINQLANQPVRRQYVIKRWKNGNHEWIKRGQLVFCTIARNDNRSDKMLTVVNLPQFNKLLFDGYYAAQRYLKTDDTAAARAYAASVPERVFEVNDWARASESSFISEFQVDIDRETDARTRAMLQREMERLKEHGER